MPLPAYKMPDDVELLKGNWCKVDDYPEHLQPIAEVLFANEEWLSDGYDYYNGFHYAPDKTLTIMAGIAEQIYQAAHRKESDNA